MSKKPVILRDLHVSILMRIYVLGGVAVSIDRLADDARSRFAQEELRAAIQDMQDGLVSFGRTRISLLKDGYFHARMVLDAIALREPQLFAANTTLSQFLEFYDRCKMGSVPDLSKLQSLQLQLKWMFRKNWKP